MLILLFHEDIVLFLPCPAARNGRQTNIHESVFAEAQITHCF